MPQHIHGLHQVKINQPTALSIGVFDGVHLGHQQLIRNLVAVARARSLLSAVLSFHPHPDILLRGKQGRFYLSRIEDRIRHLQELGVELVITHPFDETIRQKSAEEFVSDLCTRLQLAALIQGEGFALGHRRQGDIPFLVYMGKSWGYEVFTERISKIGDVIISSQSIRAALAAGSVGFVRDRLLGKAYTLRGPIVRGYQRGRQLGFPTANLGRLGRTTAACQWHLCGMGDRQRGAGDGPHEPRQPTQLCRRCNHRGSIPRRL